MGFLSGDRTDDQLKHESVAAWHRRRGNRLRRLNAYAYGYAFDIDDENCRICWFGEPVIGHLYIDSESGKVSCHLCEKCALRIIDQLEKLIEGRLKRIERERKSAK